MKIQFEIDMQYIVCKREQKINPVANILGIKAQWGQKKRQ
jgi:hypothetical protein